MNINQLGIVRQTTTRADSKAVEKLGQCGVATIHEVMGKAGLMKPYMRPVHPGMSVCGTAVTVLLQPGDNWMLHVAAEQVREGDVVVAACTSECDDGFFGELLATSFRARGAGGFIIEGGVRDVAALREMNFPTFSSAINAKGTYKTNPGSVNVPILCAGTVVHPGDAVVADDDGVVIVPADAAEEVAGLSRLREDREDDKRRRLAAGELNLDISDMREKLRQAGLRYVD